MTNAKSPPLTAGFPPATHDDWRKLVDAMLKGLPFARLETRTYDGFTIEPLYDRPGDARTIGGREPGSAWAVMQRVDHPDAVVANAQALDDLHNGATGLVLVFAGSLSARGFGIEASATSLAKVLDGVHLDADIALDIDLAPFARNVPQHVADTVRQRVDPATCNIRFAYDPLTAVALSGRIPLPWEETAPLMVGLVRALADAGFSGPFAVADGRVIHDAGGSEEQELAFALASAVAYLRALEASGMPLEAARDAIYFRLSADADQFLTMAKFRAARKLWSRIEATCGLAPKPAFIAAETAWRMMTRRDPYVNMLRGTIAVAAAGLGGADSIAALPHTAPLGLPDPFARRLARNTQLVLLQESNLARVGDPSAGSGALETITHQLCEAAWTLFQDIERAGGAWSALESGKIQHGVAAVRAKRQRAVADRSDVLTGTNQFPDIHESATSVLDVRPLPLPRLAPAAAKCEPLPQIRLAEPFERLRDASDAILARTGARPKVFLATLGKPADFTARATFAKNLFEAGGIEAVSHEGPASALGSGFKASGAAIVCLCTSDKIYESEAAPAAAALDAAGARHIYLVGRPDTREAVYRNAGVQTFVYAGCDALAILEAAHGFI